MASFIVLCIFFLGTVGAQNTVEETTFPATTSSPASHPGCGGDFQGQYGLLSSPYFPGHYPKSLNCGWLITVPPPYTVHLTFFWFDLENSTNCVKDYVAMYNGANTSSPLIAKRCGIVLPSSVTYQSVSNQMYVHMVTDGSGTGLGFSAGFLVEAIRNANTNCGGQLFGTGELTSPNYPNNYTNGIECWWLITAPPSSIVNITFLDFDVENSTSCGKDSVMLIDGLEFLRTLVSKCGSSSSPASYQSSSNRMYVSMRSDRSGTGRGFTAIYSYHSSPSFNQRFGGQLTGETGLLTSPNYPKKYPDGTNCVWEITVPPPSTVRLTFRILDLDGPSNCLLHYVGLFENSSTPIAKLCGSRVPRPASYESASNKMYVRMVTHPQGTGTGFLARFSVGAPINPNCREFLTGDTGTLSSLNHPGTYPAGTGCWWLITVTPSNTVHFTFTSFNVQWSQGCRKDYVALYDGHNESSPILFKGCGAQLPTPVLFQSSSNQMLVRMVTDSTGTGSGFRAVYSTSSGNESCGGHLSGLTGLLVSPNYPNNYPHSSDCVWLITVPATRIVVLTFLDFDLERNPGCTFDSVTVYDGSSSTDSQILKHCGSLLPNPASYQSTSNQMRVRMVTDSSSSRRGFRASYAGQVPSDQNCGRDLSGTTGYFYSPNYPDNQPKTWNCGWLLNVPTSNSVHLTLLDLDLEDSPDCVNDYVAVYDGANTSSPLLGKLCGVLLPRSLVLQSSARQMYVHMVTKGSGKGRGFSAFFSVNSSVSSNQNCGGQLFGVTGSLMSPNYPSSYPNTSECWWLITVPATYIVNLTLHDLDMEYSIACRRDYLILRDGYTYYYSPPIVRKCGNISSPVSYQSSFNQMYVKMISNTAGTRRGFRATYSISNFTSPNRSCGGHLTGESGQLTTPNYPDNYPSGSDCLWLISVPAPYNVHLTFIDFDIENTSSCRYDYVDVYDGTNTSSPLLARHCGTLLPRSVSYQSTSNHMYVHMYSDRSDALRGFNASFSINSPTLSNQNCGDQLFGETGLLTSPNYPGNYPNAGDCWWLITVRSTYIVNLTFLDFDLETSDSCRKDFVAVYGNTDLSFPPVMIECGRSLPSPASYGSTSNKMYVRMRTDDSGTGRGFRARYTSSRSPLSVSCQNLLFRESGALQSRNFPNNYPHDTNCWWMISVRTPNIVHLTFQAFELENSAGCEFDHVTLYDGRSASSPMIARHCGFLFPRSTSYQSTSSQMYVTMVTDGSGTAAGFRALYSVHSLPVSNQNCGGEIFGESGLLTSPNYPNSHPNGTECWWLIIVPESYTVNVTFLDLDLGNTTSCVANYVELLDGVDTTFPLGRLCGRSILGLNAYQSLSNRMYVHMSTNSSSTGSGFKASYSMHNSTFFNQQCGGELELSGMSGLLTSPNYPNRYPNASDCGWRITVPANLTVTVRFMRFDFERSSGCISDYVAIHNGPDASSPLITKRCGFVLVPPLSSTSNQMFVRMVTDGANTGSGFLARIYASNNIPVNRTSQTCGGQLSGEAGFLTSPNYPDNYPNNANCEWLITVPASRTVRLTFLAFNLESSSTCAYDSVSVYNGSSASATRILEHCGSGLPSPASYQSSSNQMFVRMLTDSSETRTGFRARYTAVNNQTTPNQNCGGELYEETGLLMSPNYPSMYQPTEDCGWLITAPASHIVNITFLDIDMRGSSECSIDYVAVHDGANVSSTLIVRNCGRELSGPVSYQSTSSQMYVHMVTGTSLSSAGRGFVARYSVERSLPSNLICGERLTGETGIVTSPNYPSDYPERSNCGWLITVPTQLIVNLTFLDFEFESSLGCRYDGVVLHDGPGISSPQVAKLCGRSLPSPVSYYSSSNQMYIHMQTDGSTEERGFKAIYSAAISAPRNDFGVITSLNYPELYPNSRSKEWTLTVGPTDNVYLVFLDFDVEATCKCEDDYVGLYDGSSTSAPVIARLCAQGLPSPIAYQSTANIMFVRMYADVAIQGRGFKAVYYGKNCGGTLMGLTGTFTSPNYPMTYPNNTNCMWRIVVPPEYHVELTIHDLHLPHGRNCSHALEIYGGQDESTQRLAKLCHNHTVSQTVTTTENIMIVRFAGNHFQGNQGFSASYRARLEGCGGDFSTPSGVLMSENHPQAYPHNTYCLWRITVQRGYSIQLNFTAFDIEVHDSCAYDWVEVYDGSVTDSKRLLKHCGSGLPSPPQYQSSINVMYLRMKTDHSGTARGFRAEYTSVCGGVLSEESGRLTSPNYPDPSPIQETCIWKIVANPGYRIQLTITDLNIVKEDDCQSGNLEISEGQNYTSPLVRLCHVQPTPQVITSSQNGMLVKFVGGGRGKEFSASYRRISNRCGGTFSARSGAITARIHAQLNSREPDCHWLITVESGRSAIFSFTDFDVGMFYRGYCRIGDVVIYDGKNAKAKKMLKHCGSSVPLINSYTSTSNHLYIRMKTFYYTSGKGFKAGYASSGIRCGRRGKQQNKESRIFGGQDAARHNAPWQAAFHIANSTNTTDFFCGGTVLSEYWVLSAAHCMCARNISALNVTVGRLGKYNYSAGQQSFEVADVIIHENYGKVPHDYDIALVKLKPSGGRAIEFNEFVEPACLPSVWSVYSPGKACHISGWGTTETGTTDTLKEANATIYSSHICNATRAYDGSITPRMMCAGSLDAKENTCYGDSGGPLVCSDDGRFTLYGVISWGFRGCSEKGYPSVFVNVKYLLDWIKEKTGIDAKY